MKFSIYAEDFKNITERAAVVAAKKSFNPILETVFIKATKHKVVVRGCNLELFAEITMEDVTVMEEGCAIINAELLKRVYSMKGSITVASENGLITVTNDKKRSEFWTNTNEAELYPEFPKFPTTPAFTVDKAELLETFSTCRPFLGKNLSESIFTGMNVVSNISEGRLYAMNGFYAIRHRSDKYAFHNVFNIIIPEIGKELAKIANNGDKAENLKAYIDDKHICYVGGDFTVCSRLIEGNYCNVEQYFNTIPLSEFEINAGEVCDIAKEYKEVLKLKKGIRPMFFAEHNGSLVTMAITPNYRTKDRLDIYNNTASENMRYAFNPSYVETCMKIFGKNDVEVGECKNMWVFGGNEDYSVLLVRMNAKDTIEQVEKFITKE